MLHALQLGFLNILAVGPAPHAGGGGGGGGYTFNISPNAANAPGSTGLQSAVDGFAVYALIACAAGFLLGAGLWAVGNHGGNQLAAERGKSSTFVSVGAAFLIGAAALILNFFYKLGGT